MKVLKIILYALLTLLVVTTLFINISPQFGSNPSISQRQFFSSFKNFENGEFKNNEPVMDIVKFIEGSASRAICQPKNGNKNKSKVKFEMVDITKKIKSKSMFDIIVSNPPYVTQSEKNKMHNNVLLHEPHLGLFVDDDKPLFFYKKILDFSKTNLKKNGILYFEINEQFSKDFNKLLKEEGFYDIEIKKDFRSKNRMVRAYKL